MNTRSWCRNLKNEIKTRWGDSMNLLYCSHIINKSRRSCAHSIGPFFFDSPSSRFLFLKTVSIGQHWLTEFDLATLSMSQRATDGTEPGKTYEVMTGPHWPNSSSHLMPLLHPRHCGRQPEHGCLFVARIQYSQVLGWQSAFLPGGIC